jgi:hypothetical protein
LVVCKRCGAEAVTLPRELAQVKVVCASCRAEQPVRDYVTDADRLRGVAADIMRAKSELTEKRKTGVQCTNCGGSTALPPDLSAQSFPCQYCGTHLRLADHVDARVIAGQNLRAGLDAIYRQSERRRGNTVTVAIVGFTIAVVIVVVALLAR